MSTSSHSGGKASLAVVATIAVFACLALFDVQHGGYATSVQATSTATTTVTVLNTPPSWSVFAREQVASATTSPTNSGSSVTWTGTAVDNNAENYFLLICKSSSTPQHPFASPNKEIPVCGGGSSNQWGLSASTVSGVAATVSTTTVEQWVVDAGSESFDWYAYICDANEGDPECNLTMYNGLHEAGPASATSSPFAINRRPTFTLAADTSVAPGAIATWTSTADDADTLGGDDTIQLHVCRAVGFDPTIPSCTGVQWATSSFATSNPSATTTIAIPTQDGNLASYVYVVDEHGHAALGGYQGNDTLLTIDNVAPYIASSTIQLYGVFGSTTGTTSLVLTVPEGETQNFVVAFQVSDNNSCLSTSSANEISSARVNVFRSDIGSTYGFGCDSSGEFNANRCYVDDVSNWTPVCYQRPGAPCTANTLSVEWECVFPLWHIADPTDVGSANAGADWRASVSATDNNALAGLFSTEDHVANTGAEVLQFLSFNVTGSPIAYGSFEPGIGNDYHPATTTVYATGNTGLNQYLSGDPMCTEALGCTYNATSTIWVPSQHYATTSSSLPYASGYVLSTSTVQTSFVNIVLPKTQSTSTPNSANTYWGIKVPLSITYAGDYIGKNYIDAVVAPSSEW